MNETNSTSALGESAGPKRRTVLAGSAWSVPVIALAVAAPAASASTGTIQPVVQINTVRLVDNAGFVGRDGNVYVWGFATSGQYGNGTVSNRNDGLIHQVNFGGTATDLSGNIYGYYALANGGKVYYWGEQNYNSPISRGALLNARPRPVPLDGGAPLTNIADITTTEQGGAALSKDGLVYRMGRSLAFGGRAGQFGAELMTLPWANETAVSISGGYTTFYVQGSNGRWGIWGGGDDGSVPGGVVYSETIREIPFLAPWFAGRTADEEDLVANPDGATITQIVGGIGFAAAVLSNGKVLSWGLNATACAGRTVDAWGSRSGVWYKRPGYAVTGTGEHLTGIESAKSAFTGMALLDTQRRLWGYGKSDSISYEYFERTPQIEIDDVVEYGVGQGLTMVLRSDDTIWGQGYSGASGMLLGRGNRRDFTDITSMPAYASPAVADPLGPVTS